MTFDAGPRLRLDSDSRIDLHSIEFSIILQPPASIFHATPERAIDTAGRAKITVTR